MAAAADDGFASAWLANIFGVDALTALAVAGSRAPDIELGTAVVPTYPRHPAVLAQQALTTQSALDGRLVLGIGLSHQIVIEHMFGYSFDKPARHMREYLEVLLPLLRDGRVSYAGRPEGRRGPDHAAEHPVPVLLAALAPRMLRLAGTVADGTILWMTGPDTVASHIVPKLTAAADEAGRPAPRVVCTLPICVTDDPAAARERATRSSRSTASSRPTGRCSTSRRGRAGRRGHRGRRGLGRAPGGRVGGGRRHRLRRRLVRPGRGRRTDPVPAAGPRRRADGLTLQAGPPS